MKDALNATLVVARQQYEELVRLVSVERLCELQLGENAKRKRVEVLLESLNNALVTRHFRFKTVMTPRIQFQL